MTTKSLFLSTILVFMVYSIQAQLRVHSNGTVSIGTSTSSGYALTVDGYSAIKITYSGSFMRFSSGTLNGVISSSTDKVAFWDSPNGYHQIDASSFYVQSDSSLKTNVEALDSTGFDKVMALKPCTYYYKEDVEDGTEKTNYGFLAQEVQEVLPELVDSGTGILLINMDQFIPLLVESVQIQQGYIDSLSSRVVELENALYDGGIKPKSAEEVTNENGEVIVLGQNNPNPFKESTAIPYSIPTSTSSAQIIIYDLRGEQLKAYDIKQFGDGQLIIEGNTFKAGMYIYALIVDGQYIDSKKMILSK